MSHHYPGGGKLERWSSRLTFILAAIGSAVGIGNIWRLPSVVGQNGGGAYLLPFLLAVFAFAVPLMILELTVGRRLRVDIVSAFGSIKEKFRVFGWIICLILFLIMSYYLVITGWTLAFAVFSLLGVDMGFSAFISSYQPVVFFIICVVITDMVVSYGVKRENGSPRYWSPSRSSYWSYWRYMPGHSRALQTASDICSLLISPSCPILAFGVPPLARPSSPFRWVWG